MSPVLSHLVNYELVFTVFSVDLNCQSISLYLTSFQRSWSGVNNPEGVARVLSSNVDDQGEYVYDIKYVIDMHKHRGVLHEYLTPQYF